MRPDQPSRTALRVAVRRAAHQLLDVPPVFEDPLAIAILGPEQAAELRHDPSALRIFEVDHPATQERKRRMLADAGIAIPSALTFVPVDFATETLAARLERSGFDAAAGAMFSWLGVTPYLGPEAVMATLTDVAAMSRNGGGVVFDYALPRTMLTFRQKLIFDLMAERVRAAGEPWIGFFEPTDLVEKLRALGFAAIEDLDGGTINRRYFANRADRLRVGDLARLIVAVNPRVTES
jgi:methyltransferase (TIGR00027 family)